MLGLGIVITAYISIQSYVVILLGKGSYKRLATYGIKLVANHFSR